MTKILETYTVKGGKLEQVRYVLHEFDDGTLVRYRVDIDRSVHTMNSSSKRAAMISRDYKAKICPHSIDTRELDYKMLDEWVVENSRGLWFRSGYSTYHFQHDDDAVLFKLMWGGTEAKSDESNN